MKTPRIQVNDIGDIFFLNEEGETFSEPYGSFEPEHYEAFRRIEDACAGFDALTALVVAMQAVVNAASILDNASDSDENDCMDEMFELQAALVKYRAALAEVA